MKIGDIITKHYYTLKKMITPNTVVYSSKTEEDLLQDICLTAIVKYGEIELDEEEGFSYLKKTLFYAKHYGNCKKNNDKIQYTDNLETFDKSDE